MSQMVNGVVGVARGGRDRAGCAGTTAVSGLKWGFAGL